VTGLFLSVVVIGRGGFFSAKSEFDTKQEGSGGVGCGINAGQKISARKVKRRVPV
jgi:hypothetical protein